jgi:hypothetical protein
MLASRSAIACKESALLAHRVNDPCHHRSCGIGIALPHRVHGRLIAAIAAKPFASSLRGLEGGFGAD